MVQTSNKKTKTRDYRVIFLWLFLGWFGAHRFYMKKYTSAVFMLTLTVITLYFLYDIFIFFIVHLFYAVSGVGLIGLVYGLPLIFFGLIWKGFVFIFIWWMIDLFYVLKYSQHGYT